MKLSLFLFLVGAVASDTAEASQDPLEYVMEDPLTLVEILPPDIIPVSDSSGEAATIIDSVGNESHYLSIVTNSSFKTNYTGISNELVRARLTCKNVTCSVATSKCVETTKGATCTADICLSKACHPQKEKCIVDAEGMPVCITDVCSEAKCKNDQDCVVDSVGAALCEDKVCKRDTCQSDEMCQPKVGQCLNPPCAIVPECINLCSAVTTCTTSETCRVRNRIAQCYPKSDSYTEPSWWKSIKQQLMGQQNRLKRCWSRNNVAPMSGSKCSAREKMCFFGDQKCPQLANTTTWATTRCHCDGKAGTQTWMCVDVPCPVVNEEVTI